MYVNSIKTKTTSDGQGKNPQIVKQTVATALVEGNNILGKSCFTRSSRIGKDLDQIQRYWQSLFLRYDTGPAVGKFAIDLAIQKAKEAGIGFVTVKGTNIFYSMHMVYCNILNFVKFRCWDLLVTNVKKPCFLIGSNHFGIAGWYGIRAMEQGLIVKYF